MANIWKDCLMCGSDVDRLRECFFKCCYCGQEYISEEKDMMRDLKVEEETEQNSSY